PLDGKGLPTATGGGGIGILDHEFGALQALFVVHLRADEIGIAEGIDHGTDAVGFHNGVVLRRHFLEGEAVLEARAAAPGNEDAQLQIRIALFLDQGLHLGDGAGCHDESLRRESFGTGHCDERSSDCEMGRVIIGRAAEAIKAERRRLDPPALEMTGGSRLNEGESGIYKLVSPAPAAAASFLSAGRAVPPAFCLASSAVYSRFPFTWAPLTISISL